MGQTWVPSRDDSSAAAGPIGMGQTRVGRELIELANAESVKYWRAPRAQLMALSVRNDVFWAFFRIYIGRGGWGNLAAFFAKRYISKLKTYF